MSQIFVSPFVRATVQTGVIAPGAKLFFYLSGTTALANVYADDARTTALTNPVVANGYGQFADIFLDPTIAYRVRLTTSAGVVIDEADPVYGQDPVTNENAAAIAGLDTRVTVVEETVADIGDEVALLQGTITSGRRAYATYASAVSDAATPVIYPAVTAGTVAEVPTTDAGTHTDPVVGGTVPNTGIFRWSVSPAGWQRLYATDAASAKPFADAAAASAVDAAASAVDAADSAALVSTALPTIAMNSGLTNESQTALAGTGVVVYRRTATGATYQPGLFSVGRFYDVGTDLATNVLVNAVDAETSMAGTGGSLVIKAWKRPLLVSGSPNPNLNADFGSSGDALLSTTTYSQATMGVTGTKTRFTFPIPELVAEAGYTYGFERTAYNSSAAEIAIGCGWAQPSTLTTARLKGFYHSSASLGGFTVIPNGFELADGLLRTAAPIDVGTLSDSVAVLQAAQSNEIRRASWYLANRANLKVEVLSKIVTVPGSGIVGIGDSNTAQDPSYGPSVGNTIIGRLSEFFVGGTVPTIINRGLNGFTSAQILSYVQLTSGSAGGIPALTTPQRAYTALVMIGTNNASTVTAQQCLNDNIAIEASLGHSNVIHRGYVLRPTGQVGSTSYGHARRHSQLAKVQFGGRFHDTWQAIYRNASLGTDRTALRVGKLPPDLCNPADQLHFNNAYTDISLVDVAPLARALSGGAPYVHDDNFLMRNGDAFGAAIGTVRTLGIFYTGQIRIISGNNDDIVRLNDTTGALTRGLGTMADDIREIEVQIGNSSNIARILIMRGADGYACTTGVRVKPSNTAILSPSWQGLADGPELTVAMMIKINKSHSATGLFNAGGGTTNPLVSINGYGLTYFAYNGATLYGSRTVKQPPDATNYHWYFFSRKSDGTIQSRCDKLAVDSTAGTTGNLSLSTMEALWSANVAAAGALDITYKEIWMGAGYIDLSVDANIDLFRNSSTGAAVDLGATGVVSGITPFERLHGNARDAYMGRNTGNGGDFYAPIFLTAEDLGFEDDLS